MWVRQSGLKGARERLFTVVREHLVWYQVRVLRLEHVFVYIFLCDLERPQRFCVCVCVFLSHYFIASGQQMGTFGGPPFFKHIFMCWDFAFLHQSFSLWM